MVSDAGIQKVGIIIWLQVIPIFLQQAVNAKRMAIICSAANDLYVCIADRAVLNTSFCKINQFQYDVCIKLVAV